MVGLAEGIINDTCLVIKLTHLFVCLAIMLKDNQFHYLSMHKYLSEETDVYLATSYSILAKLVNGTFRDIFLQFSLYLPN